MKRAGATHGYAQYADAITRTDSGRYVVQDPTLKADILKLRNDPAANALMAGAFTNRNTEILGERLGRAPTEGELYMAHFLGPSGAARLITLASRSPDSNAAASFRNAARSNRAIFFDRDGNARGAADVTTALTSRYSVARARQTAPATVAQAKDAIQPAAAAAASLPAPLVVATPVVATRTAPDTAGIANAYAAPAPPPARAASVRPVFPNLFSVSERNDPVAPFVKELWDPARAPSSQIDGAMTTPAAPAVPAVTPPTTASTPGGPLDLFQELKPDIRAMFRRSA